MNFALGECLTVSPAATILTRSIPMFSRIRLSTVSLIVLVFLVLSGLVAGVVVGTVVTTQRANLEGEVAKKGEAVTVLVARQMVSPLYALDVDAMVNQISHVLKLEDVVRCRVFDEEGRLITDGSRENLQLGDVSSETRAALKHAPQTKGDRPWRAATASSLTFGMPSRLADRVLGGVLLDFSLGPVNRQVSTLATGLSLVALIVVGVGAVAVWFVANFLIKPLFLGDS